MQKTKTSLSTQMKLSDYWQLSVVQLLVKFHENLLTNERAGDNFQGLAMEKWPILGSQPSSENSKIVIFANLLCRVVLFDVFSLLDGKCAPNVILSHIS